MLDANPTSIFGTHSPSPRFCCPVCRRGDVLEFHVRWVLVLSLPAGQRVPPGGRPGRTPSPFAFVSSSSSSLFLSGAPFFLVRSSIPRGLYLSHGAKSITLFAVLGPSALTNRRRAQEQTNRRRHILMSVAFPDTPGRLPLPSTSRPRC